MIPLLPGRSCLPKGGFERAWHRRILAAGLILCSRDHLGQPLKASNVLYASKNNYGPDAGPHRIAGYEDLIDEAAKELERVNEKLAAATMQFQRTQARLSQLEARTASHEESSWQV